MTVAIAARGAANYTAGESFTYYVDPSAGNDTTGSGTKAAPYATVTKVLSLATAGQSVGLKAGTTLRDAANLAPAVRLRFGRYGTGANPIMSGGTLVTGWTNTTGSIYSASLSTQPPMVCSTASGTTTPLTLGASSTTITSNQYFWASSTLYVNLGGTNPSTVTIEAATKGIILVSNSHGADGIVWRNIEFQYGYDRGVHISNTAYFTFDRCTFRYFGFVSNAGSLSINTSGTGYGRITRCVFNQLMNDGMWISGTPYIQIDYNTISQIGFLANDVQSDGIQFDSTGAISSGAWVHHNSVDMTGTSSPKACINMTASSSSVHNPIVVIEHNSVQGADVGIASVDCSGIMIRYNVSTNHAGSSYYVDETADSVTFHHNLSYLAHEGLAVNSGAVVTNLAVYNNSFIDASYCNLDLNGASVSGTIENNLCWNPTRTPALLYHNTSSSGGACLTGTSDYNIFGPAFTNAFQLSATTYSTLAAYASAASSDSHSLSTSPLLSTDGLYTPTTGSSAINGGVVISGITTGYLGAAPDIGYVEVA